MEAICKHGIGRTDLIVEDPELPFYHVKQALIEDGDETEGEDDENKSDSRFVWPRDLVVARRIDSLCDLVLNPKPLTIRQSRKRKSATDSDGRKKIKTIDPLKNEDLLSEEEMDEDEEEEDDEEEGNAPSPAADDISEKPHEEIHQARQYYAESHAETPYQYRAEYRHEEVRRPQAHAESHIVEQSRIETQYHTDPRHIIEPRHIVEPRHAAEPRHVEPQYQSEVRHAEPRHESPYQTEVRLPEPRHVEPHYQSDVRRVESQYQSEVRHIEPQYHAQARHVEPQYHAQPRHVEAHYHEAQYAERQYQRVAEPRHTERPYHIEPHHAERQYHVEHQYRAEPQHVVPHLVEPKEKEDTKSDD